MGESLAELFESRNSVRGFLPDPLPDTKLSRLFEMAQTAPSWCNIQPWRLVLTKPATTAKLSEALKLVVKTRPKQPEVPFPPVYPEPYSLRRRECGTSLYQAMGIERDQKEKREEAWLRNFEFFGAPHLVVVSRDESLGEYATLDIGVWLGMFLAAAQSLGISTCPMASIAAYPEPLREQLCIPKREVILFGVALGTVDSDVAANRTRTNREPVAANLRRV